MPVVRQTSARIRCCASAIYATVSTITVRITNCMTNIPFRLVVAEMIAIIAHAQIRIDAYSVHLQVRQSKKKNYSKSKRKCAEE